MDEYDIEVIIKCVLYELRESLKRDSERGRRGEEGEEREDTESNRGRERERER